MAYIYLVILPIKWQKIGQNWLLPNGLYRLWKCIISTNWPLFAIKKLNQIKVLRPSIGQFFSLISRACLGFYPISGVKNFFPLSEHISRSLNFFSLKIYMRVLVRKVGCCVRFERKSYKLGRWVENKDKNFSSFLKNSGWPPKKIGFGPIEFFFQL